MRTTAKALSDYEKDTEKYNHKNNHNHNNNKDDDKTKTEDDDINEDYWGASLGTADQWTQAVLKQIKKHNSESFRFDKFTSLNSFKGPLYEYF